MTRRILIDVTRTADGIHHTGIQRVVRVLYQSLSDLAPDLDLEVIPVQLTKRGAVRLPGLPPHALEARPDGSAAGSLTGQPGARTQRLLGSARAMLWSRAERSSWAAAALGTARFVFAVGRRIRAFVRDRLQTRPMRCGPEDILLLPDAAWQIDPWPTIGQVKAAGGKVVAIWYDLIPLQHPDHFHPSLPPLFEAYFRRLLAEADLLLPISRTVLEEIQVRAAAWDSRAPALAWAWPALPAPAPPPATPRPVLAAREGRPTVVMVATVEPRKGHALVLDACEALWAGGLDFDLVLAGRIAWRAEDLRARINAHPEKDARLFHLDDLSDGEIGWLLRRARVAVQASLAEGYGLPIVEAAMLGCPVICSDIPVFREIAPPGAVVFAPRTGPDFAAALAPYLDPHPRPRPAAIPRPVTPEDYARAILTHISAA
jgi:glycosyltransferase involved in cell wall biosynthesis